MPQNVPLHLRQFRVESATLFYTYPVGYLSTPATANHISQRQGHAGHRLQDSPALILAQVGVRRRCLGCTCMYVITYVWKAKDRGAGSLNKTSQIHAAK